MFDLSQTWQVLLFAIGPALVHAAAWAAVAVFAVRRCALNTPGAVPILLAAAFSALAVVYEMAFNIMMLVNQEAMQASFNSSTMVAVGVFLWGVRFVTPPLLLWGLWLTWRGYDRAGEAP